MEMELNLSFFFRDGGNRYQNSNSKQKKLNGFLITFLFYFPYLFLFTLVTEKKVLRLTPYNDTHFECNFYPFIYIPTNPLSNRYK
jgi:hypothetical protein